jgi:hypothetical protein
VDELKAIRQSLLRRLRVPVGPEDGEEAFERHILLAVRFHKAAGLNQTIGGEGRGWCQYFDEHFPKGALWNSGDAQILWEDWRVGLLKWETPKSRIAVTHGQPEAHWYREPRGTLCINLESMWDNFESSVASFLGLLQQDDARRAEAVTRWKARSWIVRQLEVGSSPYDKFTSGASVGSASAIAPPPPSSKPA